MVITLSLASEEDRSVTFTTPSLLNYNTKTSNSLTNKIVLFFSKNDLLEDRWAMTSGGPYYPSDLRMMMAQRSSI